MVLIKFLLKTIPDVPLNQLILVSVRTPTVIIVPTDFATSLISFNTWRSWAELSCSNEGLLTAEGHINLCSKPADPEDSRYSVNEGRVTLNSFQALSCSWPVSSVWKLLEVGQRSRTFSLALHSCTGTWTQIVWTQLQLPDAFFQCLRGKGVW